MSDPAVHDPASCEACTIRLMLYGESFFEPATGRHPTALEIAAEKGRREADRLRAFFGQSDRVSRRGV
jgi:hypothetical protein